MSDGPHLVNHIPTRTCIANSILVFVARKRQEDWITIRDLCARVAIQHAILSIVCDWSSISCNRIHIRIDLTVRIHHTRASERIEARNAHLHCFHAIIEDRIRLADTLQAASRDDLINRIVIVRCANDLRPTNEVVCEHIINLTELRHLLEKNLLLSCFRSILLLVGEVEAIQERFIQNASTGETTVVIALTLGVRSRSAGETRSRMYELTDLLEHNALTLKHRLKAHDLVRSQVDFIQEQNSSALECKRNRTILPDGVTVNQSE